MPEEQLGATGEAGLCPNLYHGGLGKKPGGHKLDSIK